MDEVEGDPVDVIAERSRPFDLVVMGIHGRFAVSRFLLGSVAYETLRTAEVPVVVVPDPRRSWLLDRGREKDRETPRESPVEVG